MVKIIKGWADWSKDMRLTLQQYYKNKIYSYAYEEGQIDAKSGHDCHADCADDIYFVDEMDYNIVADYMTSYELDDNDIKFMQALGFELSDFED